MHRIVIVISSILILSGCVNMVYDRLFETVNINLSRSVDVVLEIPYMVCYKCEHGNWPRKFRDVTAYTPTKPMCSDIGNYLYNTDRYKIFRKNPDGLINVILLTKPDNAVGVEILNHNNMPIQLDVRMSKEYASCT